MPRYHTNSKEVLRDGKHFADCIDDGAARLIADALNERKGMPQTQPALPLDGADGPLFGAVQLAGKIICEMIDSGKLPPLQPHTVRQENDEYACSCGKRWDIADGEEHP